MKIGTVQENPSLFARTAGAIYLVVILFGAFSEGFVMDRLVVPADAAATAHNIAGSASLWSLSLLGNLVVPLIAVPQLWIEYLILRPVSRGLAQLFLLFNIVSLAVEAVSKLFLLLVTPTLGMGTGGSPFSQEQANALAHLMLVGHDITFNIALIFFGCACLLIGYLIVRATYLPRFVGVLMQLAGACYLMATFSALFAPAFARSITPWILLPVLIGEGSLCLWLLVRGVNVDRWREQTALAAVPTT
jgi:hypothetical protein